MANIRPYIQLKADELEKKAKDHPQSKRELRLISDELHRRSSSRARRALLTVNQLIAGQEHDSISTTTPIGESMAGRSLQTAGQISEKNPLEFCINSDLPIGVALEDYESYALQLHEISGETAKVIALHLSKLAIEVDRPAPNTPEAFIEKVSTNIERLTKLKELAITPHGNLPFSALLDVDAQSLNADQNEAALLPISTAFGRLQKCIPWAVLQLVKESSVSRLDTEESNSYLRRKSGGGPPIFELNVTLANAIRSFDDKEMNLSTEAILALQLVARSNHKLHKLDASAIATLTNSGQEAAETVLHFIKFGKASDATSAAIQSLARALLAIEDPLRNVGQIATAEPLPTKVNLDNLRTLPQLDWREEFIARARILAPELQRRTLTEIAEELSVTRERVRQIEKKLKGKIDALARNEKRHASLVVKRWSRSLRQYLGTDTEDLNLRHQLNAIDSSWCVLLLVADTNCWHEPLNQQTCIVLEDPSDELIETINSSSELPVLIQTLPDGELLAEQIKPTTTSVVISNQEYQIHTTPGGTALLRSDKARPKVLADVMGVFEEHPDWLLNKHILTSRLFQHNPEYEEKRAIWGIVESAMTSCENRFQSNPRLGWIDLEDLKSTIERSAVETHPAIAVETAPLTAIEPWIGTDQTNKRILYDLIASVGAVGVKELIDKFGEATTPKKAGNSLRIMNHAAFSIPHPGLSCVLDENGHVVNIDLVQERLTNPYALKQYLQFRRSGWRHDAFPAWDQNMHERWIGFAKDYIAEDQSKLTVEYLTNSMECGSDYSIGSVHEDRDALWNLISETPKSPVDNIIPDAMSTFLSLVAALRFGFIDIYIINTSIKTHGTSRRYIAWLALLTAAGLLKAPRQWQGKHTLQPIATEYIANFADVLLAGNGLDWHGTSTCRDLIYEAQNNWKENISGTWLDRPSRTVELLNLIDKMADPMTCQPKAKINTESLGSSTSDFSFGKKAHWEPTEFILPIIAELIRD